MISGVTQEEQEIISKILDEYKKDYTFYYYGSRVKGNFCKTSDLDILIKGEQEMPLSDLVELREKFDESKLSYIVNFTDYNGLDEKFYSLIKDDLVPIDTKEAE